MKEFVIRTPGQLGPVLQGYRKTQDLTQAGVGRTAGLPQGEVSKLERDPTTASLGRIFKLVAALDLEIVIRSRDRNALRSEW